MLYLHIGLPRTGTSSLQRLLAGNQQALASAGYVYPDAWRDQRRLAHHALGTALLDDDSGAVVRREFARYVRRNRDRQIVISSEAISNALNPMQLPGLKEFIRSCSNGQEVTVVASLRRMDAVISSMYLHTLKWGLASGHLGDDEPPRLAWIDHQLASLGELRRAHDLCTVRLIPYLEAEPNSVTPVLEAMGIDNSLLRQHRGPGEVDRVGVKVSLKAEALLRFFDQRVAEMGVEVGRGQLVHVFESRQFEFRDDTYEYDVLGSDSRAQLHEHALIRAREHGIFEYVDAFSGVHIQPREKQPIDRDLASDQDVEDLKRFLLEHRHARAA